MKTVEATARVTPDHRLVLRVNVPGDITPGEHRVLLTIDPQESAEPPRRPLQFSTYPVGLVSDDFTFRREDLYDGDDD